MTTPPCSTRAARSRQSPAQRPSTAQTHSLTEPFRCSSHACRLMHAYDGPYGAWKRARAVIGRRLGRRLGVWVAQVWVAPPRELCARWKASSRRYSLPPRETSAGQGAHMFRWFGRRKHIEEEGGEDGHLYFGRIPVQRSARAGSVRPASCASSGAGADTYCCRAKIQRASSGASSIRKAHGSGASGRSLR